MSLPHLLYDLAFNLLVGSVIPTGLFYFYVKDITTFATFKLLFVIFLIIFVVLPLIFRYSYRAQTAVVFLNSVNIPPNPNYTNPEKYGFNCARNFYLTTDEDINLGVWQILPQNLNESCPPSPSDHYYENALANGQNVVIYSHGNAGSRVSGHRVELYNLLRQNFHVIAYDYRSYGDSSNVLPTEQGVVNDCKFMIKWVANKTRGNIFVWGHSLGSSISTHALAELQQEGVKISGLVLESPFNNFREEIGEFPLAKMFKNLPWFRYCVVDPMQENGFTFETDKYICDVDAPVLILHAEEDYVVPFKLGKQLYRKALICRKSNQGDVVMRKFERKFHYGHKLICRAPELPEIILNFVQNATTGT